MASYIVFSIFLLGFIILVELRRNARTQRADFLSAVSAAFILVFVVAPTILFLTPADAPILSKLFWMKNLPSEDTPYLWAAGLAGVSYLSVLAGYLAGPQRKTTASAPIEQQREDDVHRPRSDRAADAGTFATSAAHVVVERINHNVHAAIGATTAG